MSSFSIPQVCPWVGRGPPSQWITKTSLELYHPSFTSAWSFSCLTNHHHWTASFPTLSPAASLHWPGLHLSPLSPLHLQLKAVLILHHSSALRALSPGQSSISVSLPMQMLSHNSLFFCILLPEPPASLALTGPPGPPSHFLCVDCLLWFDHQCEAPHTAELNWTELSWANLSCTVLPCLTSHMCSVDEQGEYSTVWRAVWQVLCPSNHHRVTAICPAHDGTQHYIKSTVVPQPWPIVCSSSELDWIGPSWTCP